MPIIRVSATLSLLLLVFGGCQKGEGTEQATKRTGQAEARADVLEVHMTAKDFAFEPNNLRLPPDRKVELTLHNTGTMEHSIELELPGGEVSLDEKLPPGEGRTLTFTTPAEEGEFVFYCPIEDHRDRGMEGRLIVAASGEAPISQR